jgi:osmoprotectant transport system permease protein
VTAAPLAQQTVIPKFGRGSNCVRENGTFCWDWVKDNWDSKLQPRLFEHLEITAIAILIGFAIAFGAALFAYRHGWFETPFSTVAGILFTIPSIAAFQLLLPITGINRWTILIPLISYSLLIMFRNTLTGLREVPDDVREAASGMGLTPRQALWRIELPLAVPAIVAGVRSATVTTIGLATIAALVVDEGLGVPIFEAIPTSFNTELILAGGLAIMLAVATDLVLLAAQRALTPWARQRAL